MPRFSVNQLNQITMKKMYLGEIIFHLAIPTTVFLVIASVAYYTVSLAQLLIKK